MEKKGFMTLPLDVMDVLGKEDMLFVTGGSSSLSSTNNCSGRCDGTNNNSGTCSGTNNDSGKCGFQTSNEDKLNQ